MKYIVGVWEEASVRWTYEIEAEDEQDALMKAQQGNAIATLDAVDSISPDNFDWGSAEVYEVEKVHGR